MTSAFVVAVSISPVRRSARYHAPQSQPNTMSASSTERSSSKSASAPMATSTSFVTHDSNSTKSVSVCSRAALTFSSMLVLTSASGVTASGSDGTKTLSAAKAERARNATIKIATPNFMRVFYHNSSPQRLPSARKSSTAK